MGGVEAGEDLDLSSRELGDAADGSEVTVLVLEDEQIHCDLLTRAVQGQLLVEVRAGVEEGGLGGLVRGPRRLSGLESAGANIAQRGLDDRDAAASVVNHFIRGL